jgi:hypothetical protein
MLVHIRRRMPPLGAMMRLRFLRQGRATDGILQGWGSLGDVRAGVRGYLGRQLRLVAAFESRKKLRQQGGATFELTASIESSLLLPSSCRLITFFLSLQLLSPNEQGPRRPF